MSDRRSRAGPTTRTVDDMGTNTEVRTDFTGVDRAELDRVLAQGVDHGGNPIEPFVDVDGGWPLRCCLTDAAPGDRIAIVAWSPMPWRGPYAETGPVVVHAGGCPGGAVVDRLPSELEHRPITLRPYGPDRRIAYHRVRHVGADEPTSDIVAELLAHDDVVFVHGRNTTGGCYAFTATRH